MKKKLLKYQILVVFGLVFGLTFSLSSQTSKNLVYYFNDAPPLFKLHIPKAFIHNTKLDSIILDIKKTYSNNGYLSFSIDSILKNNSTCTLYIHSGHKFKLKQTIVNPDEFGMFGKKYIYNPTLTPQIIEQTNLKTLTNIQNKGFAYAVINKEYTFNKNLVTIIYKATPNKLVSFDTIKTIPPNIISYNYLSKKTGIEAGKPYNTTAIKNIKRNINQSRLFKYDTTYMHMFETQTQITIKLKKISRNSFSGFVGMQTNDEKKMEFTGNASIALANALKKGETIQIEWQKPGNLSQQLETNFTIPYIFNMPVGVLFYGNFDKQDSSFTNTHIETGLLIPTVNFGELSANVKWLTSSVNKNEVSNLNSTKSILYGLGYQYSVFDNPYLPKHGFLINTNFYVGNNTIINTGKTNSQNLLFEWVGKVEFAFSLPYGSVFIHNQWALMKNDSLKTNNLYRIGGIKTIRGFNEKSIYSKNYNYTNTEYRLYLNSESYMYLLYDAGFFYEPDNQQYNNIFCQSIGAGLSVNTQAGILSIIFAVGKKGTDPFLINKGKIHIGYINRF